MAYLYITELKSLRKDRNGLVPQICALPPIAEQRVAIGGTSAQSAALNAETRMVRVIADAICSVAVGPNPTATTSTMRLAADSVEYFFVNPTDKIAVISNS